MSVHTILCWPVLRLNSIKLNKPGYSVPPQLSTIDMVNLWLLPPPCLITLNLLVGYNWWLAYFGTSKLLSCETNLTKPSNGRTTTLNFGNDYLCFTDLLARPTRVAARAPLAPLWNCTLGILGLKPPMVVAALKTQKPDCKPVHWSDVCCTALGFF